MQQYTVKKGDTLRRIAASKGLSASHIINANPWAPDQPYLIPGQILYLPLLRAEGMRFRRAIRWTASLRPFKPGKRRSWR